MVCSLKKIVYIEDNYTNVKLMARFIEKIGDFEFSFCTRGIDGFNSVEQIMPDLILLDLNLPDMSGYDVFILLQGNENTKNIPVVGVTANAMQEDIKKAENLGFTDYITKPIDPVILKMIICKYLLQDL